MSSESTSGFEFASTPVEELNMVALRDHYDELTNRLFATDPSLGDTAEVLYQRTTDVWSELCERSEVEQPACPECDVRDWGQKFGGPVICKRCGHRVADRDLEEQIREAWNEILGGDDVSN